MDIQTQITAVTVYPDRALVARAGRAELQSGAQEIIVFGLPVQLQTDSLRASGRGEVAVKIIGVEARERPLLKPNNPTAREVQAQLDEVQDAAKAIYNAIERGDERAQTVKELARKSAARYAQALAKAQTGFDQAAQMLDFVAAQLNQIDAERAQLEIQKRENAAQQMALQSRLKQLQSGRAATERVVAVLIEAADAGAWELELCYIVTGARWTPLYDARVQTQTAKFQLSLNAMITQRSGEDWNQVALKLSTARPGLGSLPPKLDPIWVDEPRPIPAGKMMKRRVPEDDDGGEMLEAMRPAAPRAAPAPAPIEAEEVVAEVESTSDGATVEFSLPHRLSVPGDGQSHRAAIAVREFPTQFDYLAIPRRVEIAYLRARATNDSNLALLQGEVSIFRDGVFVGKAHLKNTAPGGEFELFLGPDEQVRARREMTARETDKNFIGNVRRVHFAYEIELHNLKAHAVVIAVQDQIPVSRSENIKIKLRGAAPEATQSDLGLLDWSVNLGPNEKRALRFDYGVETPRDTSVVGLAD